MPRIERPQFHVIVLVPRNRIGFCRTLASSTILHYPPPTLVGYRIAAKGDELGQASAESNVRAAYQYLKTGFRVKDSDLVLVLVGNNVAFQLSPEVLVERYHESMREAHAELAKRYGYFELAMPGDSRLKISKGENRFTQTVLAAVPDVCSEDQKSGDVTCTPQKGVGHPGNVGLGSMIGPVKDVRAIYERAVQKLDGKEAEPGQTFVKILNEQQRSRESANQASQKKLGESTWKTSTPPEAQSEDEFSVGVDRISTIFYAKSVTQPAPHVGMEGLAKEILSSRPPYPGNSPTDITYAARSFLPLHDATLDLPFNKDGSLISLLENSWSSLPLLKPPSTPNIPATILSHHPQRLWYAPHARALLREASRRPQAPIRLPSHLPQNLTWDYRGGASGYWTTNKNWLTYKDICGGKGIGDQVFGDFKGSWGQEEGWETRDRLWNFWGQRVIGEGARDGKDEPWQEGFPGRRGDWEDLTEEYLPWSRYRGDWEWPADGKGYAGKDL